MFKNYEQGERMNITYSVPELKPTNVCFIADQLQQNIRDALLPKQLPDGDFMGIKVFQNNAFPFTTEDGTIVIGAMYNNNGDIVWLINGIAPRCEQTNLRR